MAVTFGFIFLAVGLLGFINDPVLGLFEVNPLHNWVHILSGVVALGAGFANDWYAKLYNVGFGAVYALVTLLGLLSVEFIVDLLDINTADNVLHLLITAVLLGVGLTVPVDREVRSHRHT